MAALRLFLIAASSAAAIAAVPEQINLHYTNTAGVLSVDFVASDARGAVAFTLTGGATVTVNTTSFNYDTIGYLHQGVLDLSAATPGQTATYRVFTASGTSSLFTITPIVSGPTRYATFGDFGLVNDESMADLVREASAGSFDAVLHVGDWAYDLEDTFSLTGNLFMNLAQGYMATKPTAVAEGNHEACTLCSPVPDFVGENGHGYNFTQYKARFHSVSLNSNSGNNRYYSFNNGLTHFIVFTAEAYLYARSEVFLQNQLAFMAADLAAVDRKVTPWVVALAHKDWTMSAEAYAAFSPLLQKAGVDILFCGHVHYYNRYMPYDAITGDVDTAAVSADGATYTDAKYMTVIVSGASGDIEGDDGYRKESPSYTGTENYGWGIFTPLNATHATWSFKTVKADNGPADYSDSLTFVQHSHVL